VEESEPPQKEVGFPQIETECYTVKQGETLEGIANRYHRKKEELAKWNYIPYPYILTSEDTGRCLRVEGPSDEGTTTPPATSIPGTPVETPTPPVSTPITTPPIPDAPNSDIHSTEEGIHIVQLGETLPSIAARYGQKLEEVAAWNNLEHPYYLSDGQRLVVYPPEPFPVPASELPTQEPTQPILSPTNRDWDYHLVLPGDTLYSIAKHYSVSAEELRAWNDLQSEQLSLGQKLWVRPPELDSPTVFPSPDVGDNEIVDDEIIDDNQPVETIDESDDNQPVEMIDESDDKQPFDVIDDKQPVENRPSYHLVKSGETLDSIANKYGVPSPDLAKWNGIGPPYTVWPTLELTLFPPR